MMEAYSRSFPAKLLLFGEYTVLNGSQALSIPLHTWTGAWEQTKRQEQNTDFFDWLKKEELIDDAVHERMCGECAEGWAFEANIPVGYGVGSSGAYVAGIYDRYLNGSYNDVEEMTGQLARMESYFHGSSSGMDPLVSYADKSVYKDERGKFHLLTDQGWPDNYNVYLLDSGNMRETVSLVNRYREYIRDENNRKQI